MRTNFDVALDFTGSDRSALLTFLSKARRRIGIRRSRRRPLRDWVYNAASTSSVRGLHTVDLYFDLVRQLDAAAVPVEPGLRLPDTAVTSARGLAQELGLGNAYFAVQAGTARPEKFWPAESWAEVIVEAHRFSRLPCVLTGGKNRLEVEQVRAIRDLVGGRVPCYVLAGRTDLLLSCAIIRGARFFLGVDSVGAHVAAVFQRPALVLFGPTNPFHWRPRHPGGRVVRAGFDHDYEPVSPTERGQPMAELSTMTVIRAMEHLRGMAA
ncbi:MAG: glycosyltransferase family 9 protein [Verrucomicrobia bacterium]|nr:glycosyltransferase family 9 protein [Verrucomicrobiota bacterium]